VTLEFRPGRVSAVLGPNGSGKTTLIRTVLGLVRQDAGTITLAGERVGADSAYRDGIGYMPQTARFPENLTAREIMAMLEDLRGRTRACDRTLLDTLQLAAVLDVPVRTLSGGSRQKVSAAIAFLFDPPVVILDEPTAGLDPVACGILKDRVRAERARGKTIVLTSHVLSEVEQLADDVAVLVDGAVSYAGALHELRTRTHEASLERAVAAILLENRRSEAAA
jgi:Cu-processing system ATP-binding protein